MLRKIKRYCIKIRNNVHSEYVNYIMKHNPMKYADMLYYNCFNKRMDWKNPKDLNEIINYLAFKTDTTIWSKLADKYLVRNYVKERGLESLLVPLLATYKSVEEINLDNLPKSFVLKWNNDSGSTIIVQNKNNVKIEDLQNMLRISLSRRFGLEYAEPHYLRISPLLLAEKYITNSKEDTSITDYKVWCLNGMPFCIFTVSNRKSLTYHADYNVYDLHWNKIENALNISYRNTLDVQRPIHLNEMLSAAAKLADGFPQVRVDFYEASGKLYFGEMTFTSYCGRMNYFTPEYLLEMGKQVNIHDVKVVS